VVSEPAVADSEQRAFCSDESGEIRAASDGKATTCISGGEEVEKAMGQTAMGETAIGLSPVGKSGSTAEGGRAAVPQTQQPSVPNPPVSPCVQGHCK
jgi:hypothetical protein